MKVQWTSSYFQEILAEKQSRVEELTNPPSLECKCLLAPGSYVTRLLCCLASCLAANPQLRRPYVRQSHCWPARSQYNDRTAQPAKDRSAFSGLLSTRTAGLVWPGLRSPWLRFDHRGLTSAGLGLTDANFEKHALTGSVSTKATQLLRPWFDCLAATSVDWVHLTGLDLRGLSSSDGGPTSLARACQTAFNYCGLGRYGAPAD